MFQIAAFSYYLYFKMSFQLAEIQALRITDKGSPRTTMASFWKASAKALWIASFCAVFLFIRNEGCPGANHTDGCHNLNGDCREAVFAVEARGPVFAYDARITAGPDPVHVCNPSSEWGRDGGLLSSSWPKRKTSARLRESPYLE